MPPSDPHGPSGFTSRPIRPSTECASSSQCQRSRTGRNGGGQRSPSPTVRPSSCRARSRPAKLINRIDKDRSGKPRPNLALTPRPDLGGARRDRTDDLMLAKHALSQLSYGPVSRPAGAQRPVVVGLGGLEPPTSRLSSARSNQLSYKPGRRRSPRPLAAHQAGRDAGLPYPWIEKERRRRRGPANAA